MQSLFRLEVKLKRREKMRCQALELMMPWTKYIEIKVPLIEWELHRDRLFYIKNQPLFQVLETMIRNLT